MARETAKTLDLTDLKLLKLMIQSERLTSSQLTSLTGFDKSKVMIHLTRLEKLGYIQSNIKVVKGKKKGLVKCYSATKTAYESPYSSDFGEAECQR